MRPHGPGGYVSRSTQSAPPSNRKATLGDSSPDVDYDVELDPSDFVRGRWEVPLQHWSVHCLPNGCMVCVCPCVTVAQISVRIGADSFGTALTKQLAFHSAVGGLLLLELVYCYRYIDAIFGSGTANTTTPPIVIFSACVAVMLVSFVWVRALARLRAQVRERFAIRGSLADDQCAMATCTPCAIAQMATQVKSYTRGSCDFRAPETLPAYIP